MNIFINKLCKWGCVIKLESDNSNRQKQRGSNGAKTKILYIEVFAFNKAGAAEA